MHGDHAFTAPSVRGRQPEMTYAGALSFLRRRYTKALAGVDVVVSGIPFDSAVTYRPGTRLGPAAIRAASVQLAELPAFPWGFDPLEILAVTDYGDCFLNPHQPQHVVTTIADHARTLLQSGARMLTLGGDHFVTYPLLKAHAERYGPLALLHFDAHPDTWPDEEGRLDHGTMFLRALNEGLIDPAHSLQIGIRTHAEPQGFTVLTAPWVHEQGVNAVVSKILRVMGDRPVYLTFDIDCLDPAFAPGTGTPVVGGLSTAQALAILRALEPLNLVGMDVVEVSPPYDVAGITALAGATVAHDFLCLLARHKQQGRGVWPGYS